MDGDAHSSPSWHRKLCESPVTASDVSELNVVIGRFVQLFVLVMFLDNLSTLLYFFK